LNEAGATLLEPGTILLEAGATLLEAGATFAGRRAGAAALRGALRVTGSRTAFLVFTLVVILFAAFREAGPKRRTAKRLVYATPLAERAGKPGSRPVAAPRPAAPVLMARRRIW
jgi:hypothetical protein